MLSENTKGIGYYDCVYGRSYESAPQTVVSLLNGYVATKFDNGYFHSNRAGCRRRLPPASRRRGASVIDHLYRDGVIYAKIRRRTREPHRVERNTLSLVLTLS